MNENPSKGACLDCNRKYGDEFGFPDLSISDEVWKIICPEYTPGGLLCPSCICARAYRAGISARAVFTSGPFEDNPHEIINALEEMWDNANAVGLDGWIGPERGEEPDEYAIVTRRDDVVKAYYKIRGTWM